MLTQQPLLVLDGALATELERRAVDLRDPLWSAICLIERPEVIRAVHLDYFKAGADLATTASYQATFEGFARRGIDFNEAAQIMRASVMLAVSARDEFWADPSNRRDRQLPLIAASLGPYGAMLADGSEYRGRYAISDRGLMDFHEKRLQVMVESGADLLACETIPCLREALALARLLERHPSASAWISFSCSDGEHTCEGDAIAECAAALNAYPQVVSVGVNCTRPEYVSSLLRCMKAQTDKPLVVYPNSGEVYDATVKQWRGCVDVMSFAARARDWYFQGARLIGGCCRITPHDIRAVKNWASADLARQHRQPAQSQ